MYIMSGRDGWSLGLWHLWLVPFTAPTGPEMTPRPERFSRDLFCTGWASSFEYQTRRPRELWSSNESLWRSAFTWPIADFARSPEHERHLVPRPMAHLHLVPYGWDVQAEGLR